MELFYGPFFSSLSVAIFFLICIEQKFSRTNSIILTLILAFSTTVWAYSNTSLNLVPGLFFVLLGYLFFKKFQNLGQYRFLIFSSAAFGFGFLIRSDVILFILPIWIFLIVSHSSFKRKLFSVTLFSIPSLFAYPYGEADEKIIELLKEYKFKVAFGQHSGVINETSNMYYLPRFSMNEKYGAIDRVKFTATAKGLGVYDFIPSNPTISENPPYIGFSVLDQTLVKSLNCFLFDSEGQVEKELFKFNERIEIRLKRKLNKGRSRINCTTKDKKGNWRWYGHQFYL